MLRSPRSNARRTSAMGIGNGNDRYVIETETGWVW